MAVAPHPSRNPVPALRLRLESVIEQARLNVTQENVELPRLLRPRRYPLFSLVQLR
jgi:hypothetical protein